MSKYDHKECFYSQNRMHAVVYGIKVMQKKQCFIKQDFCLFQLKKNQSGL